MADFKATIVSVQPSGAGQYLTEKPFHEVVEFYARKSRFAPPNWSILGRKFSGDNVLLPAHWAKTNFHDEEASVSILHFIRENVTSAQFLITEHAEIGIITIAITHTKSDGHRLIQILQHPASQIKRAAEQGGADHPVTAVESKSEGKEKPKLELEVRS